MEQGIVAAQLVLYGLPDNLAGIGDENPGATPKGGTLRSRLAAPQKN